ncbi:MAG: sugar ABC transporter permease [Microbacteriaceae bacterium]|nr:sugar ABC transporter permease [Microbacteriaceae bacterium]
MSEKIKTPIAEGGLKASQFGNDGSLGDYIKRWFTDLKGGKLGSLPIAIGIVIIAVIFQSLNSNFLTPVNFVNLTIQGAAMAVIAMGVVFVLLIGEIDLSVGFVSGVGGATMALLLMPVEGEWPTWAAVGFVLVMGLVIGLLHGLLITKLNLPSFVVTLAGFLGWSGVVLLLLGTKGTVIIQDQLIIGLTSGFLPKEVAWVLLVLSVAGYFLVQFFARRTRKSHGLNAQPISVLILKAVTLLAFGGVAVYVANLNRGIGNVIVLIFALFVLFSFVLGRTRVGLWIYAVGGNKESARRAGINTDRIRIYCFMLASMLAVVGGIILASRLRSVDATAGGGSLLLYSIAAAVIGGTSLFGGRGSIRSAILGAIVIAAIDNGLSLLGLGSGIKFVITGLVLLAAVTLDSISRKGKANTGKV